ncbi:hypothetical protein [Desulfosporosinus nitroreducens]|uniref:hypothetical protein n=1 Tax=Desulfosporosinus nitroreducens TaxID=2018668 RepID=UPI00207D57B6|nr:hypothetical protein [Desulfosporosinus nitroreducens]MCO1603793.1 hypothetical protein [Desulfosporosinus nitroreducens]
MFPWAMHVETVVLLSHKNADTHINVNVESSPSVSRELLTGNPVDFLITLIAERNHADELFYFTFCVFILRIKYIICRDTQSTNNFAKPIPFYSSGKESGTYC